MRKFLFPIQKLAMVFFYLQLLLQLDKVTYAVCSLLLMGLSLAIEGARPYTPLLFLIIILEMLDLSLLQVLVVLLAGLLLAVLKIYDINVPLRGPLLMGHRYKNIDHAGHQLQFSLFYPTLSRTRRVEWIPKGEYNKVLYQIFHVDPKARRIPYPIFQFIVSYIHKIYMPVEEMSPYLQELESSMEGASYRANQEKVIVFSHGLGSHMNAYSSIFANWASQGYTVISLNHDRDEVCVDYRKGVTDEDPDKIKEYLFQFRNRDLKVRVQEVQAIISLVQKEGFMKENLGVDIKVKQIILGGHSFGGGTAIATKAYLNQKYRSTPQLLSPFSKIICLDPWLFPFQREMFNNLHDQNILIINSQYFYREVPYIYALQTLFAKLKQNSSGTLKAFLVRGMDHIAQCDMAYVFGNILQYTGSIKKHHLTDKFMALNILMCQLFLEGKDKGEILEIANKFAEDKKMLIHRVRVEEQFRVTRELTFGNMNAADQQQFAKNI